MLSNDLYLASSSTGLIGLDEGVVPALFQRPLGCRLKLGVPLAHIRFAWSG